MKRYPNKLTTPLSMFMVVVFMVIVFLLSLTSCGSAEVVECSDEKTWFVDDELNNAFVGAINLLEAHGANLDKYRYEDLNVFFVDEFSSDEASENSVALATWINRDGIRIEVLRSKWETPITGEMSRSEYKRQVQLSQENVLTMVHEIAHDLFDLDHYENGWDIMNSTGMRGQEISQEQISNSIYRILDEARRVYDKKSLEKRF